MDLTQRKLTKTEWESIEVPVSSDELYIIKLILAGFNNVNETRNHTPSILKHMKIAYSDEIDTYVYVNYFHELMRSIAKKYDLDYIPEMKDYQCKMKKSDLIRMSNTEKYIVEHKDKLFEFILINLVEKMFRHKTKSIKNNKDENEGEETWLCYYYTLKVLITYNVYLFNKKLKNVILTILENVEANVNIEKLLSMAKNIIEQNEYLLKYADDTLYEHQKKLFTICKRPNPKLVLYIAPTGTGKTLSPLGLSEKYRVIFVCAARHVGLALAKAAVSANKKIAFAFGCNDAADIRLHYFAATEYTKNRKSGGIGKVDNSVGTEVEIIICDIKSYIPAMLYMLAFNKKENIIMYWDEPTITMDYEQHEFHSIIKQNWSQNLIPNVVLSSATLPQKDDLADSISDFMGRFEDAEVHEIISHDCKKTIPIINSEGFVEMPHYLYDNYDKILDVVYHCKKYKTLLRYIDLGEAVDFIMFINNSKNSEKCIKNKRYSLQRVFTNVDSVNMSSIKTYYLDLLGNIVPEMWPKVYKALQANREELHESNINIVTTDAHSLTDGPTIFLADDVTKVAKFYIQSAKIPDGVVEHIMKVIDHNQQINETIKELMTDYEDALGKDADKDKKMSNMNNDEKNNGEIKGMLRKIDSFRAQVKSVVLDSMYIPNTKDHLYKYAKKVDLSQQNKPFTCNISETIVEKIMLVDDIEDYWKLLLLMGVGVFANHSSNKYNEIMKELAQQQKLFVIIASSDYIYGTNYQFCHGYIGKDLGHISQEKCIQAMGRVGRNKLQQDYSVRFRDDELIRKLFNEEVNKPEVKNMNALFCS